IARTAKKGQKSQGLQVPATRKQVQLNQICVHREAKSYQETRSNDPQFALRSTAGQEQHQREQRQVENHFDAVRNVCNMSSSEGTRSNAECCRAKCDTDNPGASPSPLRRDRTDEKECERDEDRMTHQPDDPIPLGIGSGKGFANQRRCCDQAQAIHAGSDCEEKKRRIAGPAPLLVGSRLVWQYSHSPSHSSLESPNMISRWESRVGMNVHLT